MLISNNLEQELSITCIDFNIYPYLTIQSITCYIGFSSFFFPHFILLPPKDPDKHDTRPDSSWHKERDATENAESLTLEVANQRTEEPENTGAWHHAEASVETS